MWDVPVGGRHRRAVSAVMSGASLYRRGPYYDGYADDGARVDPLLMRGASPYRLGPYYDGYADDGARADLLLMRGASPYRIGPYYDGYADDDARADPLLTSGASPYRRGPYYDGYADDGARADPLLTSGAPPYRRGPYYDGYADDGMLPGELEARAVGMERERSLRSAELAARSADLESSVRNLEEQLHRRNLEELSFDARRQSTRAADHSIALQRDRERELKAAALERAADRGRAPAYAAELEYLAARGCRADVGGERALAAAQAAELDYRTDFVGREAALLGVSPLARRWPARALTPGSYDPFGALPPRTQWGHGGVGAATAMGLSAAPSPYYPLPHCPPPGLGFFPSPHYPL